MATVEECTSALEELATKLDAVDEDTRKKHVVDRSLSCRITDLEVTYTARLGGHGLSEVALADEAEVAASQIRLAVSSDDLLALCDGSLGVAGAWTSGRLKIEASMMDVLRLRSLL